uniref:Zinc finger GATA like protein 1 n=1 Tax=Electrophorus electricus TaxID=8005 RepID=A0A4W4EC26_ELEEL
NSAREDLGPEDLHVTQSSILYLLQEATKLASPANHSTPLRVLSMLSSVQASSPWEVMSLINLQCERLLHSGQSHEEDDACTRTTKTDSLALITGNAESGCVNAMECSSLPSSEITVVSKDAPQTSLAVSPSSYRTDLNNNQEDNKDEKPQEPGEAKAVSSTQPRWGNHRRTPRKQAHPARSPDLQDPELQGVTFSMHTELDHNTDQCRLLITSNYRQLCRRGRRSRGSRSRSMQSSQRTSSSEEESDPASLSKKICASCCTRKTPLWRDAEDGTPLCNACGIRYKKYRVRCLQCWNIPRKEANSNSKCLKCGDVLQLSSQNKRAGW